MKKHIILASLMAMATAFTSCTTVVEKPVPTTTTTTHTEVKRVPAPVTTTEQTTTRSTGNY